MPYGIKRTASGLGFALALMAACNGAQESTGVKEMGAEFKSSLSVLSGSRILFGHQSVGSNILGQLRAASAEAGIPDFPIVEVKAGEPVRLGINHASVGENTKPESKCEAFEKLFAEADGAYDAALMKFCYVDFSGGTDVKAVLEMYTAVVARLKAAHPEVTLVHMTVPLKTGEGLKGALKKVLGRGNPDLENIRRNEYNALLVEAFRNEPIFDLARLESTRPDGSREEFKADGKTYYRLHPAYTNDGGHLNQVGGRLAAGELVRVLAAALGKKAQKTETASVE